MTKSRILHLYFFCAEYVAIYTYESPETGDLTFHEGDTILVTQREGEWWSGCIDNRTGIFPSNYVKPKETDVRLNSAAVHFFAWPLCLSLSKHFDVTLDIDILGNGTNPIKKRLDPSKDKGL